MRSRTWTRVFGVGIVLSIIALALTQTLPGLMSSNTEILKGPTVPYGNSNYTISEYFIPPVPAGENVSVTVYGYEGRSILLLVTSAASASSPPIAGTSFPDPPGATLVFNSNTTQAYHVMVTSLNRTQFVIVLSSTWSEFYFLGTYSTVAVFLVIACVAGFLYYLQKTKRDETEEMAVAEARGASSTSNGGGIQGGSPHANVLALRASQHNTAAEPPEVP